MTALTLLGIFWLAGIALARWLHLPWLVVVFAIVPFGAALVPYWRYPRVHFWVMMALALTAGVFRFIWSQPMLDETYIAY